MFEYVNGFKFNPTSVTHNECKKYAATSIFELDRERTLQQDGRLRATTNSVTQDLQQFAFRSLTSGNTMTNTDTGYRNPKRRKGLKGEKLESRPNFDELLTKNLDVTHQTYFKVCIYIQRVLYIECYLLSVIY